MGKIPLEFTRSLFFILKDVQIVSDLESLYQQSLPYLKDHGWRIEFASPFYQEIVSADEVEWYSDIQESTTDFFPINWVFWLKASQ